MLCIACLIYLASILNWQKQEVNNKSGLCPIRIFDMLGQTLQLLTASNIIEYCKDKFYIVSKKSWKYAHKYRALYMNKIN